MRYRGYAISGLIGFGLGVLITAWATKALPRIVSRTLLKTMNGMMDRMQHMIGEEDD
jgi:hypothetical protein